jgi:hypothetical protein
MKLTQFPVELLREVILTLPRASQCACLLSCRILGNVARPILFRRISVVFGSWEEPVELNDISAAVVDDADRARSLEILNHICSTPEFGKMCHRLIVFAYARDGGERLLGKIPLFSCQPTVPICRILGCLLSAIVSMQNLQSVAWVGYALLKAALRVLNHRR